MKIGMIVGVCLCLLGCADTPEEAQIKKRIMEDDINEISSKLPDQCVFKFLGGVKLPDRSFESEVFVIDCTGTGKTTSSVNINTEEQNGKTTTNENVVILKIDKTTGKVVE